MSSSHRVSDDYLKMSNKENEEKMTTSSETSQQQQKSLFFCGFIDCCRHPITTVNSPLSDIYVHDGLNFEKISSNDNNTTLLEDKKTSSSPSTKDTYIPNNRISATTTTTITQVSLLDEPFQYESQSDHDSPNNEEYRVMTLNHNNSETNLLPLDPPTILPLGNNTTPMSPHDPHLLSTPSCLESLSNQHLSFQGIKEKSVSPDLFSNKQNNDIPSSLCGSLTILDNIKPCLGIENEDNIKYLESLLDEVIKLNRDEYVLQAHDRYMQLMQKLNTIFVNNRIEVYVIIRAPNYLDTLKQSLFNHDDPLSVSTQACFELRKYILGNHKTPHSRMSYGDDTGSIKHGQQQLSSTGGLSAFPSQLDSNGATTPPKTRHRPSSLILSAKHKKKSINSPLDSSSNIKILQEYSFPTGILCESCLLCPLNKGCVINRFKQFEPMPLNEILGLKETSAEEDTKVSKKFLGRTYLQRYIWPLEDLKCIAFTTDEPMSQLLNTSSLTQQQQSIDMKNRKIDGLSLPVDLQVAFIPGDTKNSFFEFAPEVTSENPLRIKNDLGGPYWTWLYEFVQKVINNPQIHRMRIQFNEIQKALAICSTDILHDNTWNRMKTKTQNLAWKMMKDGNALCIVEGTLEAPLFESLCIINETDLHKNWIPFLSSSGKIHQVSDFCQILTQRNALPWPLDDRESVLVGYATDGLHLSQHAVIMNAFSIPDAATSFFGLPLSRPGHGLTRLHIKFFTFHLCPDKNDHRSTRAKFIVYMDPQMLFVPKAIQSFIARQSAIRIFGSIQKLSKQFESTIYASRVKQNPTVYENVERRLNVFYGGVKKPC